MQGFHPRQCYLIKYSYNMGIMVTGLHSASQLTAPALVLCKVQHIHRVKVRAPQRRRASPGTATSIPIMSLVGAVGRWFAVRAPGKVTWGLGKKGGDGIEQGGAGCIAVRISKRGDLPDRLHDSDKQKGIALLSRPT